MSKKLTRAYKIGHSAAVKMLPNRNPFVPNTSRWHDFNAGYKARIEEAKASGVAHPEDYQDA